MVTKTVCVIGAGPCGLAFLNACSKLDGGLDVTCFEKQSDWGGQWNYSWRAGVDENGEAVHSSMYRYLWSNGPKECLEMNDYTFDEHFRQPVPSFPPREVLADYLFGRAKARSLRQYIRFSVVVRNVSFSEATRRFTVVVEDYGARRIQTMEFDYVVTATGHFSVPNIPDFVGIDRFPGRVLHAHDFKDALEFKDKNVLCIGGSYSAEDIALQLHKYGSKKVTLCVRSAKMGFAWPSNIEELGMIDRFDGGNAVFVDGTVRPIDAVILCTGYRYFFPFLAENLRFPTKLNNELCPALYKGVALKENPQLFFAGMQDQWWTFSMFDVQGHLIRDFITGKNALPAAGEMQADIEKWKAREEAVVTAKDSIAVQADYMREIMPLTDYPKCDVGEQQQQFHEWKGHKAESITDYRDKAFRSVCTGTMAPVHHTKWTDAMDDSLECFMQSKL